MTAAEGGGGLREAKKLAKGCFARLKHALHGSKVKVKDQPSTGRSLAASEASVLLASAIAASPVVSAYGQLVSASRTEKDEEVQRLKDLVSTLQAEVQALRRTQVAGTSAGTLQPTSSADQQRDRPSPATSIVTAASWARHSNQVSQPGMLPSTQSPPDVSGYGSQTESPRPRPLQLTLGPLSAAPNSPRLVTGSPRQVPASPRLASPLAPQRTSSGIPPEPSPLMPQPSQSGLGASASEGADPLQSSAQEAALESSPSEQISPKGPASAPLPTGSEAETPDGGAGRGLTLQVPRPPGSTHSLPASASAANRGTPGSRTTREQSFQRPSHGPGTPVGAAPGETLLAQASSSSSPVALLLLGAPPGTVLPGPPMLRVPTVKVGSWIDAGERSSRRSPRPSPGRGGVAASAALLLAASGSGLAWGLGAGGGGGAGAGAGPEGAPARAAMAAALTAGRGPFTPVWLNGAALDQLCMEAPEDYDDVLQHFCKRDPALRVLLKELGRQMLSATLEGGGAALPPPMTHLVPGASDFLRPRLQAMAQQVQSVQRPQPAQSPPTPGSLQGSPSLMALEEGHVGLGHGPLGASGGGSDCFPQPPTGLFAPPPGFGVANGVAPGPGAGEQAGAAGEAAAAGDQQGGVDALVSESGLATLGGAGLLAAEAEAEVQPESLEPGASPREPPTEGAAEASAEGAAEAPTGTAAEALAEAVQAETSAPAEGPGTVGSPPAAESSTGPEREGPGGGVPAGSPSGSTSGRGHGGGDGSGGGQFIPGPAPGPSFQPFAPGGSEGPGSNTPGAFDVALPLLPMLPGFEASGLAPRQNGGGSLPPMAPFAPPAGASSMFGMALPPMAPVVEPPPAPLQPPSDAGDASDATQGGGPSAVHYGFSVLRLTPVLVKVPVRHPPPGWPGTDIGAASDSAAAVAAAAAAATGGSIPPSRTTSAVRVLAPVHDGAGASPAHASGGHASGTLMSTADLASLPADLEPTFGGGAHGPEDLSRPSRGRGDGEHDPDRTSAASTQRTSAQDRSSRGSAASPRPSLGAAAAGSGRAGSGRLVPGRAGSGTGAAGVFAGAFAAGGGNGSLGRVGSNAHVHAHAHAPPTVYVEQPGLLVEHVAADRSGTSVPELFERLQRDCSILSCVAAIITVFDLEEGHVLHQNALSVDYMGYHRYPPPAKPAFPTDRLALRPSLLTGIHSSPGLPPPPPPPPAPSRPPLLLPPSLAVPPSTPAATTLEGTVPSAAAPQPVNPPPSQASASLPPGWAHDRCDSGRSIGGAISYGGASTTAARASPSVLERLFELDPYKLPEIREAVMEGQHWTGIVKVPPNLLSDLEEDGGLAWGTEPGGYEAGPGPGPGAQAGPGMGLGGPDSFGRIEGSFGRDGSVVMGEAGPVLDGAELADRLSRVGDAGPRTEDGTGAGGAGAASAGAGAGGQFGRDASCNGAGGSVRAGAVRLDGRPPKSPLQASGDSGSLRYPMGHRSRLSLASPMGTSGCGTEAPGPLPVPQIYPSMYPSMVPHPHAPGQAQPGPVPGSAFADALGFAPSFAPSGDGLYPLLSGTATSATTIGNVSYGTSVGTSIAELGSRPTVGSILANGHPAGVSNAPYMYGNAVYGVTDSPDANTEAEGNASANQYPILTSVNSVGLPLAPGGATGSFGEGFVEAPTVSGGVIGSHAIAGAGGGGGFDSEGSDADGGSGRQWAYDRASAPIGPMAARALRARGNEGLSTLPTHDENSMEGEQASEPGAAQPRRRISTAGAGGAASAAFGSGGGGGGGAGSASGMRSGGGSAGGSGTRAHRVSYADGLGNRESPSASGLGRWGVGSNSHKVLRVGSEGASSVLGGAAAAATKPKRVSRGGLDLQAMNTSAWALVGRDSAAPQPPRARGGPSRNIHGSVTPGAYPSGLGASSSGRTGSQPGSVTPGHGASGGPPHRRSMTGGQEIGFGESMGSHRGGSGAAGSFHADRSTPLPRVAFFAAAAVQRSVRQQRLRNARKKLSLSASTSMDGDTATSAASKVAAAQELLAAQRRLAQEKAQQEQAQAQAQVEAQAQAGEAAEGAEQAAGPGPAVEGGEAAEAEAAQPQPQPAPEPNPALGDDASGEQGAASPSAAAPDTGPTGHALSPPAVPWGKSASAPEPQISPNGSERSDAAGLGLGLALEGASVRMELSSSPRGPGGEPEAPSAEPEGSPKLPPPSPTCPDATGEPGAAEPGAEAGTEADAEGASASGPAEPGPGSDPAGPGPELPSLSITAEAPRQLSVLKRSSRSYKPAPTQPLTDPHAHPHAHSDGSARSLTHSPAAPRGNGTGTGTDDDPNSPFLPGPIAGLSRLSTPPRSAAATAAAAAAAIAAVDAANDAAAAAADDEGGPDGKPRARLSRMPATRIPTIKARAPGNGPPTLARAPIVRPFIGVPEALEAAPSEAEAAAAEAAEEEELSAVDEGSESDSGSGEDEGELSRWHEISARPFLDPVSRRECILLVQTDVTAKVETERRLAELVDAEHKILEQIFPRHVLEWMALDTARAAQGPACAFSLFNKRDCTPLATKHAAVTILFADIKGFTSMCKEVEPEVVMGFLNDLYNRFDSLLDVYGVYKVETIGDCYMVAGGLMRRDEEGFQSVQGPGAVDPLHATRVMSFAKAMLREAAKLRMPLTGEPLQIRVGIHSGPVMSGVVGTRMPRFCLFGDTVNTASRMESTAEVGCIHVSADTQGLLNKEYWQSTGGVEVKGKGLMETFVWLGNESESAPHMMYRGPVMGSIKGMRGFGSLAAAPKRSSTAPREDVPGAVRVAGLHPKRSSTAPREDGGPRLKGLVVKASSRLSRATAVRQEKRK
ncbi:hypothetical protein HYH03_008518 [Edaphochlamys debaryana]|uniref:Guanylate cyclase domain-containing protein n=1 Tax=Edaphochlamys debaryana TaxID=47281 RepID=A0A835Y3D5_9CHLO|nr:hypothetical protein HYH03_008518 [Edaphochlamys debaryana]|eukprot:KAG2493386.1 hypothetical protein HYH03_008518 [Edaphochlamys debaryana]